MTLVATAGDAPTSVAAWVVIIATQVLAVGGDALGQRTVRVVHKHSRRRMLMSFTIVSALQTLVILGFLELVLPASVTGAVYIHRTASQCFTQYEVQGCCPSPGPSCPCVVDCGAANSTCTAMSCPPQGPSSFWRSIAQHPLLLINGAANTVYYLAETVMYRHPLGLVMLVIASLTSSILFKPFSYLFGLSSTPLPAAVLLLGLVGALLCIADKAADASRSLAGPGRRRQGKGKSSRLSKRRQASHESGVGYAEALDSESAEESARGGESFTVGDATTVSNVSPVVVFERDGSKPLLEEHGVGPLELLPRHTSDEPVQLSTCARYCQAAGATLHLLPAYLVLSVCYCLWFVFMRFFNDLYRVNAWGFNSYDQVTIPFFVFPALILIDLVPLFRRGMDDSAHCDESLWAAFKRAMKELTSSVSNFATVFFYRGIVNARAIAYSYLAIWYNLSVVYLELTLVRVVLAWLGAIMLAALIPGFIRTTPEERARVASPLLVGLKAVGTALVVVALVVLAKDKS